MGVVAVLTFLAGLVAFHWGMVLLGRALNQVTGRRRQLVRQILVCALISGLTLVGGNVLDFPMAQNWIALVVALFLEGWLLLGLTHSGAAFLAMEGVLCGLNSMLFYRSVLAVVLGLPLSHFNHHIVPLDALKLLPITLGYCSAGVILLVYSRGLKSQVLIHLTQRLGRVGTLLASQVLTVACLLLQAGLYQSFANTWEAKVWSLAACLFLALGYYFVFSYGVRVTQLYTMKQENSRMEQLLQSHQTEQEQLQEAVERDGLTGLYRRQMVERKIYALMEQGTPFYLSVIDLDGLKYVNDRYGHQAGDEYLLAVAKALRENRRPGVDLVSRYGGDEFLAVWTDCTGEEAEARLQTAYHQITEANRPYPMSISYGTASWQEGDKFHGVLAQADSAMYRMKKLHKEENRLFVRS